MKILAFSDVHRNLDACRGIVEAATEADLVIGAGDFASAHVGLEETLEALRPIERKAIYVPGNNETADALKAACGAIVLHGEAAEWNGIAVVGIGAAIPPLPPLPWNSFDLSEEEAETMLGTFERADILITHSPPHDTVDSLAHGGRRIGSRAVRSAAERLAPTLVLCGHVHDSWGQRFRLGQTLVANLGPAANWFEMER